MLPTSYIDPLLWPWPSFYLPLQCSVPCSSLNCLLDLPKVLAWTCSHSSRGFLSREHLWANEEKMYLQCEDKALRLQDLWVPHVLGWTVIGGPPFQANAAYARMTTRQAEEKLVISPHQTSQLGAFLNHPDYPHLPTFDCGNAAPIE